jgi:2-hydroxy-6-oxonona-2,4-dienedioate hydrolase
MTIITSEPSPADFVAAIDRASARRTTSSDAGTLVWRIWGSGPLLVLLHGGTGSWMHWVRNVEDLATSFTLIVPDLPGSGESGTLEPPMTAAHMAESLWSGLQEIVGTTRFSVAGFSLGGLIAGFLARLAGDQVDRLVLVGSGGMRLPRRPMEPLKSWRWLSSEDAKRDIHRQNLGILMIHDPREIDELAVHIQYYNAPLSRVRGKHIVQASAMADCVPYVKARVAGIWGEHDVTSPVELVALRLREFQPQATFDMVPGAGHWVQYEASDLFNRRLRARLQPSG